MKNVVKYQNKHVLVVGLGKSGIHAAYLLKELGADVTINDKNVPQDKQVVADLENDGIKVVVGSHPLSLLDDAELIVKNPGIPYSNPLIARAQELGLTIITEPELAYEISDAQLVGVTGTNGKTTTTTLIALMLNQNAKNAKAYPCGNIGIPATETAKKATANDTLVMELSSFQLMGITELHPKIAVLTNIYEAHTDYHGSRENYIKAKLRILKNQTEADYFVVNYDDEEWRNLSQQAKAKIVPFSRTAFTKEGAYELNGLLYFKDEKIMDAADIKVPGTHNLENALAAIAVAKIEGISNEAIVEVLTTFSGVRHRTQYVTTFNDRKFYNDSKATNIEATEKALAGFNTPIVLLAGGLDRGFTFERLIPYLQKNVHAVVLFGETKELLKDAAKAAGVEMIIEANNVVDAVPLAYQASQPGDTILLSPACASWDQWKTFEERGDKFIEAVEKLEKEEK
ncbi:UDP-N-acetylmuramoyl-L-alanine--D-glutamate ligase [Ligilactobacillus apodemi]|uniref:UDP-N-acetylmuramoylalanine--D-glutamate ligase n=1 Tax=Ligilactobacillus apodemi DSM 16634 = JCM 16172 TaxID=1423724 RepID=A0A0R1TZV1_9LACO|nr:UDP-N-acetylmuramoyl-L-alanine--D-glutamate ligase [Ligilactobacillus apodemi]KRL84149.1 UDP-N-acetylmuramoyl-L-alanyl-D-glutamate synthetase [Ligilactobacillus apodemi DSM 16634 = JCM 16172]